MLGFGPLAFASPAVLWALVALPGLWWLLRVTPPAPKRIAFPALRLLRDLDSTEETPAHTPWWLILLRLLLALAIILGLAQPLWNPGSTLPGSGPVVLIVDTGWGAAPHWDSIARQARDLTEQARRENRQMVLVTTAAAPGETGPRLFGPRRAAEIADMLPGLEPHPWPADHAAVTAALEAARFSGSVHAVFLSDGLAHTGSDRLITKLERYASADLRGPTAGEAAHLLRPPRRDPDGPFGTVQRAMRGGESSVTVQLLAADGGVLGRQAVTFAPDAFRADLPLDLPAELAGRLDRLQIEGERSAGAVWLFDDRWQSRRVGVVAAEATGTEQPLLSDLYYLRRALQPAATITEGEVSTVLNDGVGVLVLADIGSLPATESATLSDWVDKGGVLIRFAGPRLAEASGLGGQADPLLPVRLRGGERSLGGALSWDTPQAIGDFSETGLFADLPVPPDVRVSTQVLAEPALDLAEKTWIRLQDGTPLVTGTRRGEGWVVLVHVTAGPAWSDLPLSGFFVTMLDRLVSLGQATSPQDGQPLLLHQALDGFGRLTAPPPGATPVAVADWPETELGPDHPPGRYRSGESERALNLGSRLTSLSSIADGADGVTLRPLERPQEVELMPALLTLALVLAIADLLVSLMLRGLLPKPQAVLARVAPLGLILVLATPAAAADGLDMDRAMQASTGTWLAYVTTGDSRVDRVSQLGLEGLSRVLQQRTSVDARGAMAVDLERDELSFFPILYWPVVTGQASPSGTAIAKLNRYMRTGGVILFDTKDGQRSGEALATLRRVAEGLDIPPLTPVPAGHVLGKTFYLLDTYPGRYANAELWVQAGRSLGTDGVSPIIVGGNDYAAAWALDESGQGLFAMIPGGERQRELARRVGVNLVMYVLTGTYKEDQVHVPYILERLGQ